MLRYTIYGKERSTFVDASFLHNDWWQRVRDLFHPPAEEEEEDCEGEECEEEEEGGEEEAERRRALLGARGPHARARRALPRAWDP